MLLGLVLIPHALELVGNCRVRDKSSEGKKTMVGLVTREEFNAFPRDFANVRSAVSFLEEIRCIDVNASHVHGA